MNIPFAFQPLSSAKANAESGLRPVGPSQPLALVYNCLKYSLTFAYRVKKVHEYLKDLFSSGKLFAWILFNIWSADATRRKIKEIDKVVEMFNKHISGVVNALLTNLTNAMAECLNGKIQELKTVGRGYRTFPNFRIVILFFHGGLDLYPH